MLKSFCGIDWDSDDMGSKVSAFEKLDAAIGSGVLEGVRRHRIFEEVGIMPNDLVRWMEKNPPWVRNNAAYEVTIESLRY